MRDLASEETSVESMSELLDELERVRDRQEKIIALLRKSSLRPDVRFTLDDAIKQAEHDLDEYNALLTRYGRSGNAARPSRREAPRRRDRAPPSWSVALRRGKSR